MINKIIIDGDLVLSVVEKVQVQLVGAIANSGDIEIEFVNIGRWDLAGIRLLCAFKKYCTLLERELTFRFPKEIHEAGSMEWMEIINNYRCKR